MCARPYIARMTSAKSRVGDLTITIIKVIKVKLENCNEK